MRRRWVWMGIMAVLFPLWGTASALAAVPVEVLGIDLTHQEQQQMLRAFGVRPDVPAKIVYVSHDQELQVLGGIAAPGEVPRMARTAVDLMPERMGSALHVHLHNIRYVTAPMYVAALATAGVSDESIRVDAPAAQNGIAAFADMLWGYQAATGAPLAPSRRRLAARELVLTANLGHRTAYPGRVVDVIGALKEQVVAGSVQGPSAIEQHLVVDARHQHLFLSPGEESAVVLLMERIARLPISAAQIHRQTVGPRREGVQAHVWWSALARLWQWVRAHILHFPHPTTGRVDGFRGRSVDSKHQGEILVRP